MHISAMANAYVKDPRKIAKPGDVVRVKVLEVDPKRRRISLTMRLDHAAEARPTTARAEIPAGSEKRLHSGETRAGSSNPGYLPRARSGIALRYNMTVYYLDDLHVGQRFTSGSQVLDEAQIKRFAP